MEIIKERISEIKQDKNWKEKVVEEWNNEINEEGGHKKQDDDQKSTVSYRSNKTGVSKQSLRS